MLQQKPPLIVKTSSSPCIRIFDCGIYSNRQMNVYLTSTVKRHLVKFHSGIITQTPRLAPTCLLAM